jgi:hypothetical protein
LLIRPADWNPYGGKQGVYLDKLPLWDGEAAHALMFPQVQKTSGDEDGASFNIIPDQ